MQGLDSLDVSDRSLPVFQCQLNLFSRYYDSWTQQQSHQLIQHLTVLDAAFVDKLQEFSSNTCL